MKQILSSALVFAAVGAIGLSACDASPPPDAGKPSMASETIPPGETLVDVVRKSLAETVRDPDAFSRARRLGALLPTLGPELVPAVQQTLDDQRIDLTITEIDLLLRYWATHQPDAASRWAKDKSPTSYREAAIFSALSTWAQDDPQAAVSATWNWVDDASIEGAVPAALVRGWYARNDPPEELREFLRSRPPGFPGQRAIATYVRLMLQTQGAEAVRRWAESLPDDEEGFKLTVFRRTAFALAMFDKQAAMRWCDDYCDGPHGKAMRTLMARSWVVGDGPGTFAWLSSAPEGYERDIAVRGAFGVWAQLDREPAMAWMATMTTGEPPPWLEPAYLVYARLIASEKPTEAIQWASRIENAQDREETQIVVARIWRGIDEAAAESWLLQSSLSEPARAKAREPIQQQQSARQ